MPCLPSSRVPSLQPARMHYTHDGAVADGASRRRRSSMWLGNSRPCYMCQRRCHRIDAIALAHLSQRAHCLASQEMTASTLKRSNVLSHRADGAAGVWQIVELSAPRLGSRGFSVRVRGVSLCRAPSMFIRPMLGPDRGLRRNPCVCGLTCTLSKGAACLRPIERPRLLDCVVVSCGIQQ